MILAQTCPYLSFTSTCLQEETILVHLLGHLIRSLPEVLGKYIHLRRVSTNPLHHLSHALQHSFPGTDQHCTLHCSEPCFPLSKCRSRWSYLPRVTPSDPAFQRAPCLPCWEQGRRQELEPRGKAFAIIQETENGGWSRLWRLGVDADGRVHQSS